MGIGFGMLRGLVRKGTCGRSIERMTTEHTEPARRGHSTLPASIAAKICTRDELVRERARLRGAGRALVHCHGCFDIVHPGHIRHLRQARGLGDALLVSVTGDAGIAKGTGRPLIPEELRAENLAALDCVDLVYVEPAPTAEGLLRLVQPDVYVKGKEYESNNDPRFLAEREAVERAGGRVVFSSGDVVFSSTALIAAMENTADPFQQRLTQLMNSAELSGPSLYSMISSFRGKRVVVIGEPIIDTYIMCDRPEIASESPVMTLRPIEARHYDGGAAIVARHAAALGARPVLVIPLPRSPEGAAMVKRLEGEGVEVRTVETGTGVPEKQRFLVGAQKVMKLDLLEPYVLDAHQQEEFLSLGVESAREISADATIVTDFGLGLFSSKLLSRLCREVRPHTGVLSGDVSGKRSNLRAFVGADLICPSESELRDAMRLHSEGLPLVVWRLFEETRARGAIITLGAEGLIGFTPLTRGVQDPIEEQAWTTRLSSEHVPALCPIALDPLGCGDSLLTAASLALAGGGSMLAASFLGACAASTQVQRLGNVPVSTQELRRTIARVHSSHLAWAGRETIESRQVHTRTPQPLRAS